MHSTSLPSLLNPEALFPKHPDHAGRELQSRAAAHWLLLSCIIVALTISARAQSGTVRGRVTDETSAVIPGASITARDSSGKTFPTLSTADGSYLLRGLPPGNYSVDVEFIGFVMKQPVSFTLRDQPLTLNLVLSVRAVQEQVNVEADNVSTVSVDSSGNAGALVLQDAALDSLADNPDDLAADLQALAGPAAGPSGSSFYIDGFSTGVMPPKDSIREIRINQNPFSPEFDKLGLGRIEIFTKPGSDKLHGSGLFNLGTEVWNSRNPYAAVKAPFLLREYGGSIGGPLNRHASYALDVRGDATTNGAVINGSILDPTTLAVISPATSVFSVPQHRILATPRLDYQLGEANTLTLRYRFSRSDIPYSGVGAFNLPESAYHANSHDHTLQATDTIVLGPNVVNETRFQFFTINSIYIPRTSGPALQVLNAFTGGGSVIGNSSDDQKNTELQNITTINRQKHSWHFGGRLRTLSDSNSSQQNFNGIFTFGGGTGPQLDANNNPALDSGGHQIPIPITSIEQYRRTLIFQKQGLSDAQIRALGGGSTQFTIGAGNPLIQASQIDVALFAGDEWKLRPNLTLNLGLRYELQNNISDPYDFAPRVAIAWAPQRFNSKLVFRGGFGLFYDRFALSNTINSLRYNGANQAQYVIKNPAFYPTVPSTSTLASTQTTQIINRTEPDLHAPFSRQTIFAVERQLPAHTVVAVTYSNTHGLHELRSVDLNAPLAGVYPLGNSNPIFAAASSGIYNQNQILSNVNSNINKKISLFGSYTFNHALSDTDGLTTFPANPYSRAGEYGPSSTDVHHIETFGGTINALWSTTFSPLLSVYSGAPFNITVGRDIYGTTLFNGRPGIATDVTRAGLVSTRYGLLDPNPIAGETILSRNSGRGPGSVIFNLRVSKAIGIGPKEESKAGSSGPAKRRYNAVVTMQMRNLTNHNNPGPIIGNIGSSLFGRANYAAGSAPQTGTNLSESANNRRLELQLRFTF